MNLKEAYSIEIEATPPFNFELTVHKPAGWWWSTPDETFEKDTLWTVTRFKNALLGLKLKSLGTIEKPRIRCTIFSKAKISKTEAQDITRMVKRALNTEQDITEFYKLAQKDKILNAAVKDLYGMRTVAWPELFPALILAVTLQMAPLKRSDQMMQLLMEHFGENAHFDGKTIRYWPSPQKIAATTTDELKTKAKLGYRATNLRAIAETLKNGFPTMDELSTMNPEEAKKKLLTLKGIGEYSAELVMPGMGFPLDVWSAKIFHILFLGKEPDSPREAITALKEIGEKRWGKWKGYAFVYVLNNLPEISQRIGFDLSQF
jgi:DNA-3-methyladenine glycosylase II